MNHDSQHGGGNAVGHNPFWICLIVFLALAVDAGVHCSRLLQQRRQLKQLELTQAANIGRLAAIINQSPQVEARLQSISLDLLRLSRTNAASAQIVREFNITYTPGQQSAAPAAVTDGTNAAYAPSDVNPAAR